MVAEQFLTSTITHIALWTYRPVTVKSDRGGRPWLTGEEVLKAVDCTLVRMLMLWYARLGERFSRKIPPEVILRLLSGNPVAVEKLADWWSLELR
jgi:hypothetical protein